MSDTLRKNLLVLFLLGGVFHFANAITINLEGFPLLVFDEANNEPLIGVNIYTSDMSWSAATDIDGKAEMPNLNFRNEITFSYIGYDDVVLPVFKIRQLGGKISMTQAIELMEAVVIVGRRDEDPVEIPYEVTVVKASDIEFKNSQTAADALSANSEVYMQKSQLGGGSPIVRGFEANKVLLVLDGVRLNNAIYRNGHLQNAISVDNAVMDQIEVIYGPGSLVYGSDALGGVVHFRTKDPDIVFGDGADTRLKTNAMTRFSSANLEKSFHVDVNFGMRKVGTLTAFTYSDYGDLRSGKKRTAGYPDWGLRNFYIQRVGGLDQVFANPDPTRQIGSGYKQIDFLQKVKYQPNDHFYLVGNFQYSANGDIPRYDRLTKPGSNELKFAEWKYGQQRLLASLKARFLKPAKLWDTGTVIYAFQRVDEDRFKRKFGSQRRSYNLEEVHINSLTVDFDKGISADGRHKVTYGIDANHNSVSSEAGKINVNSSALSGGRLTRYPSGGSTQTQFGTYIDYRWRTADSLFNIRAGLRYSNITLNVNYTDRDIIAWPDAFYTGLTSKNDNLSYAAAITYNSKNGFQGRLIYSSAFRSPNIDDWAKIREKNGYVTIPNPNLQPELSPMNLEFTLAKEIGDTQAGRPGKGFKISGTSFYTIIKNAIVRRPFNLPDGSSTLLIDDEIKTTQANVNATSATIMGLSGNIIAKLDEHWSANASYNWIKGEAEDDELENKPLSHIPPAYGRASVAYQNDKWKIEGNIQFNSEKPWEDYALDESDNEEQALKDVGTPAWMTYNVYSSYKLNDKIGINLAVENIADIHYRPFASGISAAGRNFIISLRGKF